jgi:hypothetical protein
MLIANPIYDSVFKYMMDDNKVAKLLLSAIIGKNIVKLDYRPTEVRTEKPITVLYIDFIAKIKDTSGEESLVIIEVQKAKIPSDIMRFRRYLGHQYINENNVSVVNELTEPYAKPLPIISIYFLGYPLDHVKAPVIKVERQYIDVTTGKIIKEKEEFIECLTHNSFVIQIPYLKNNRKTELLRVLSIFDQSNREMDFHILNVDENDFPEKYRPIIRRLQRANSEKQVRDDMTVEDTYVEDYKNLVRALAENKKALEEKKKALEEKDKVIEENKKALEEKDRIIEELRKKLNQKQ